MIISAVVSNSIVKNQEELKKAEKEVEHSGKIINAVFQAIPDEFILFNRDGIYLESQGSEISLLNNSNLAPKTNNLRYNRSRCNTKQLLQLFYSYYLIIPHDVLLFPHLYF